MPRLGDRLVQTRPTVWLMARGATGGVFRGIVADFDERTITVARDDNRREVVVPRSMF